MNAHITGIGGIFFRSSDPQKTRDWYASNFGLAIESWGCIFPWRDSENPEKQGMTTWSPFKNESDYFGSLDQPFMINYIVRDLDLLLEELKAKGIEPVKESETIEFGKFAWIDDVDGRRIELWQPA